MYNIRVFAQRSSIDILVSEERISHSDDFAASDLADGHSFLTLQVSHGLFFEPARL